MNKVAKPFRQQFLELFTGSTLAQVFSLLLMPVISRIYLPADFGEYAIYVAISSIIGGLSNLRLDVAGILADDEEGAHLVYLGSSIATGVGLLVFGTLLGLHYSYLFAAMTALSTTAIGISQLLVVWHSKHRNYRLLASRSAGEKLVVLGLGIALGWIGYTQGGLIVAQTVGLLFSVTYLYALSRLPKWHEGRRLWLTTFKKFSEFPRKNALSTILTSMSVFLPSLLFAAYFDKSQLGHYNLANRLFEIPINLIGYTFSTVYYQHSSNVLPAERLRLFWKTLRLLSLVFIPSFALVMLIGPELFGVVFGEVWRESGLLARWLAPVTLLRLLFISQSSLLLVGRRLNLDLRVSTMLFAAQVGGFFFGYQVYGTVIGCVMSMALFGVVVFTYGLIAIQRSLKSAL